VHLSDTLLSLGAEVHATIDSAPIEPRIHKPVIDILTKNVSNWTWDVADYDSSGILKIIDEVKPEVIFHTIGLVNVLTQDLYGSLNANTISIVNLCHAIIQSKNQPIVIISSTDKVYGKCQEAKEDTPMKSGSLYQTTKICGDLLVQMFLSEFNIRGMIMRSANFYGPYDWHQERLIPTCILSCLEDNPIQFRSDGKQV